MDPLLTVAIWALGVFGMVMGTWLQDKREQRRIENLETTLVEKINVIRDTVYRDFTTIEQRLDKLERNDNA